MAKKARKSGILLHPTSLPSPYGIGDLGEGAYHFIDFLSAAGQSLWQILPLGPTGYGDSPYQSFSAFAGQPLLISPDELIKMGYLDAEDLSGCPTADESKVDYGQVIDWKNTIFRLAYDRFKKNTRPEVPYHQEFDLFCKEQQYWLSDYALFMALKDLNGNKCWLEWDLSYRSPTAGAKERLRSQYADEMEYYRFLQFLFFKQWQAVKDYAHERGISIIGDIPIFVSMDSADVWANQHLFYLDECGYPLAVSGVPPDYFSETGQLWGNPLYKWEEHQREGFSWWISRIRSQLSMVDILRVDHFRGFEAYWSIPYGAKTAINGQWIKAPGTELFKAITNVLGDHVPIIAEDLGVITPEVTAMRKAFSFPGMKVLQFAFDSTEESDYLPHQFTDPNCVCYTGTHDNDTTLGWYATLDKPCKEKVKQYTGVKDDALVSLGMIKTAIASIAMYAVFPLQDLLCLGSEGRMNTPGTAQGNWTWRFKSTDLTPDMAKELQRLCDLYGRNKE